MFRPVRPINVIVPPHLGPFSGGNGPRSPPGGPQNQGTGHPYVCGGPLSHTLIGLLLELAGPRSGFRVLSEYIIRQGDAYTARTGLPFPAPIPTRDRFNAMWKSLTAPLALSPSGECADPPIVGSLLAPTVVGTIRAVPASPMPFC